MEKETKEDSQPATLPTNPKVLHENVKNTIEAHVKSLGLKNFTMDITTGSEVGDNFMGFIGKLTITGTDTNGSSKTFNWIVKSAPNSELYRVILNIAALYSREIYVYEKIFPIFKQFQIEKKILKPFNEYPDLILTHPEYMFESIVMEDMKSLGYSMANKQKPLDFNHVKLVIKAYAKFHAISYALRDQKLELFEELCCNTKDVFKGMGNVEDIYKNQRPLMDAALETLNPIEHSKEFERFKKFSEKFIDIVQDTIRVTNRYSVIEHGDSWMNNMIWKYDNDSKNPKKVCLLDWQICRYGSPALDLSYFLFTCTDKSFRDKHYEDAIKLYYYTLSSMIHELGSRPEDCVTFEELQEELKTFAIAGVYSSVFVLYIITRESSEIPDFKSENVDSEEVQKKWAEKSVNYGKYEDRVRGIIVDAYAKGYLDRF